MPHQDPRAEMYAIRCTDMPTDDLLDELESAVRQNKYGSHNEQRAIVRAELLRRAGGK